MTDYDVIVVGIGPAGLAAGLYSARRALKTLLVGEILGGQMALAHIIENYPGFANISGIELSENMKDQAEKAGCEIKFDRVIDMHLEGEIKTIKTPDREYTAKVVILATGSSHRRLNVEGEEKFIGKGVSYCLTCDAPLFRGKRIAIIGGSDTAVTGAIYASDITSETYLIHRRDQLRAEEANQRELMKRPVKIIWNTVVEKVEGKKFVEKLILKNINTNKTSELKVDGVFIEVGEIPTTEIAKKSGIEVDEKNFIKVNENLETNIKGIFAAGDVVGSLAQITVCVGQGSLAATNAYFYIKGVKEKIVDWQHKPVRT